MALVVFALLGVFVFIWLLLLKSRFSLLLSHRIFLDKGEEVKYKSDCEKGRWTLLLVDAGSQRDGDEILASSPTRWAF